MLLSARLVLPPTSMRRPQEIPVPHTHGPKFVTDPQMRVSVTVAAGGDGMLMLEMHGMLQVPHVRVRYRKFQDCMFSWEVEILALVTGNEGWGSMHERHQLGRDRRLQGVGGVALGKQFARKPGHTDRKTDHRSSVGTRFVLCCIRIT